MVDPDNYPDYRAVAVSGITCVIGHQIARGGFSVVYRARDVWGNDLAIKIYNSEVSPMIWAREIENYYRFRHPHIVHMYAGAPINNQVHIVMENGGVAIGRINVRDVRERRLLMLLAAKGMLEGLHFLHSAGFTHTDINPGNAVLKLTPDNTPVIVKLCDLGLTRPTRDLERGKHTSRWSPPPENYDVRFGDLGPPMDIYCTALVLLELLIGKELPNFSEVDIMAGAPQELSRSLGDEFGEALAEALDPVTSRRLTASELWQRLAKAAQGNNAAVARPTEG